MEMTPLVIRQGDHLDKLAFRHGFDPDAVWQHPANAALRELRQDPCVLAPGDVLHIPRAPARGLPFTPRTTNRYVARVPQVDVHLLLHSQLGDPLADEPYEIEGLPADSPRQTGPAGSATFSVPVFAREVTLVLTRRNIRLDVRVGDLDPIAESSGTSGRLANLGFLEHSADEACTAEQLTASVATFQRARGLPATGALDEPTRAELERVHSGQADAAEKRP